MTLPKNIIEKLEKLQHRAHRIICGTRDCKTCVIPLKERRIALGLRLFGKLTSNENHPLHNITTKTRNGYTSPPINNAMYRNTFVNQCIIRTNNIVID